MTSTEYKEQLSAALRKIGGMLPLGFEYTRLTGQNAPLGGVDYLGQEATRAMYADLLAWQRANKPESFVTEARWQELYASQNGNVPFYSEGDGSTTFRFPRVVGYFKGADSTDALGQYIKEGLPGHTHTRGTMNITGSQRFSDKRFPNGHSDSGSALYTTTTSSTGYFSTGSDSASGTTTINLDASRSWTGETSQPTNPVYGNSPHVTPETVTVVLGVIAFGSVASIGEATEEGIVAELGEIGAQVGEIGAQVGEIGAQVSALEGGVGRAKAYITETWSSGTSWYRKWSDGWIEQGGTGPSGIITLYMPFSNTNYTITHETVGVQHTNRNESFKTTTSFGLVQPTAATSPQYDVGWYACGY